MVVTNVDDNTWQNDLPRDLRLNSLHDAAQMAIAQGIRTARATKRSYRIYRPCKDCGKIDQWDATYGLVDVRWEYPVTPGTRADIVLDYENAPQVVIEVVVTNDLSAEKRQVYTDAGIICLRVFPTVEGLDKLLTEVTVDAEGVNPDIFRCADCADLSAVGEATRAVRRSLEPHCINCGEVLAYLSVFVVEISCWKCEEPMLMAFGQVGESTNGSFVITSELPEVAIAAAIEVGAILRVHYSRTMEEAYRANTCGSCGTFVGERYIFDKAVDALYEISEPHSSIRPVRTFGFCPTCSPPKPMTPIDAEVQQARKESDDRFRAWQQERKRDSFD